MQSSSSAHMGWQYVLKRIYKTDRNEKGNTTTRNTSQHLTSDNETAFSAGTRTTSRLARPKNGQARNSMQQGHAAGCCPSSNEGSVPRYWCGAGSAGVGDREISCLPLTFPLLGSCGFFAAATAPRCWSVGVTRCGNCKRWALESLLRPRGLEIIGLRYRMDFYCAQASSIAAVLTECSWRL